MGASLPKVNTHPPTKQSLGGMESVSGSISQHMASLEAKNEKASGNTAAAASAVKPEVRYPSPCLVFDDYENPSVTGEEGERGS